MRVTKSPRPTEESNLRAALVEAFKRGTSVEFLLLALVLGLGGVLEPASVFDSNGLTGLGLVALTLLENCLGNTHDEYRICICCFVSMCGKRAK